MKKTTNETAGRVALGTVSRSTLGPVGAYLEPIGFSLTPPPALG